MLMNFDSITDYNEAKILHLQIKLVMARIMTISEAIINKLELKNRLAELRLTETWVLQSEIPAAMKRTK